MTLAITTVVASDQILPSILLTVTSTTGSPSPVPVNSRIVITRIHADGSRHGVLTNEDPRVIGGGWSWFDVHCPFNQMVTYEVVAAGFTAVSAAEYLSGEHVWLMSPSNPEISVQVPAEMILSIGDRAAPSRAARFQPMSDPGATSNPPVYISDGARGAVTGSIVFEVTNEQPVVDLLAGDEVILIRCPDSPATGPGWDIGWMWVHVDGWTVTNPSEMKDFPTRDFSFSFEEAADPDMAQVPAWTAGDAADYFASIGVNAGGMSAFYANAGAMVTDTRLPGF